MDVVDEKRGGAHVGNHGGAHAVRGGRAARAEAPAARPGGGAMVETGDVLTSNTGLRIADDQNSLKAGPTGPVLLEDQLLREKINHFDHERIPERVVHARGSAAHGYFELTESLAAYSRAKVLGEVGQRVPVFVRFSTVAGSKGSPDLARDVRGFAVKFYTQEGNWDLVGNNIPVFFIQDAIKFPDLIHAAKPEPDRGFPQAQTAHDTFWDFVSLTPESMHMIMWIMSDRTIPRSYRMMEGFGVHSFRLIDEAGKSTYVKFHWRPKLGAQSVVWDEALKINGADPDFHRRDLWNAIDQGDFPEFELAVQLFDEAFAQEFDFDVLDSTKIIPEELIPLRVIGRMVLDRNPDNFFAETEQVAFCTSHVVPGIDFTNDPLLQGRNFSYLDTQLKRLGGPNFQQIPINRPQCPMRNFQRDGHMQMMVPKGRAAYFPNSLLAEGPGEDKQAGFASFPARVEGDKLRVRPDSFADHYSQARQFFMSQTEPEQDHIVSALTFELSKVETKAIRARMLGNLAQIEPSLAKRVATGMGFAEPIPKIEAARPVRTDLKPSPALSILAKAVPTLKGRLVGCLATDGVEAAALKAVAEAVEAEGGKVKLVAPRVGGVKASDGTLIEADFQLAGGPSVLFDAVVILASAEGGQMLAKTAEAVAFAHDAFAHLKVIGHDAAAMPLLQAAGVEPGEGVIALDGGAGVSAGAASHGSSHRGKARPGAGETGAHAFVAAASKGRVWAREKMVHPVF